jgi:3D (Asp-Asp-Asp) domain-containing protein
MTNIVLSILITAYCPCTRCCGKSDGITASGRPATAGRTAAMNGVQFGTVVRIEGVGRRVVEDRLSKRFDKGRLDIFMASHEEALHFGRRRARVELLVPSPVLLLNKTNFAGTTPAPSSGGTGGEKTVAKQKNEDRTVQAPGRQRLPERP